MNQGIFRLIFNRRRGAWMAAAEFVRGHGRSHTKSACKSRSARRRSVAMVLLAAAALDAAAAPRLPTGTVPVPVNAGSTGFVSSGAASYADPVATATGKALTIIQTSQKAVLNWGSFNVAAGSSVTFSHPSTAAATLNKIGGADPSVIQGVISSTARDTGGVGGGVYLINRNGILFDRGAQVNVGGLVASALDIADDVFMNGLLSVTQGTATTITAPAFTWGASAEQFQTSHVRVEAGAEISTGQEGRVMLLAPMVENRGSIVTPQGQTILAAGAKVYLASPVSGSKLRGFLVEVDPYVGTDAAGNAVTMAGTVVNRQPSATELAAEAPEINERLRANGTIGATDLNAEQLHARVGQIIADRGNITLAALAVNQQGLLKATTSVDLNGSIYLQARDKVIPGIKEIASDGTEVYSSLASRMGALSFGAGSVTEVAPDTANMRTLRDDQAFNKSEVRGAGKTIVVEGNAAIVARAGEVSLTAQDSITDAADMFGGVSDGSARVYLAAGSRIDASGLRDIDLSVARNVIEVELRGNELKDSPLQRTGILAGEKVLIDIRAGTRLADVSGYIAGVQRGIAEKSSTGGSIVLKSEGDAVIRAGASLDVSGGSISFRSGDTGTTRLVADGQSIGIGAATADRTYTSFVKDTYRYETGYVEGKDAGTVAIYADKVALEGNLKAGTVAGIYQRDLGTRPLGGKLTVGRWALTADGSSAALAGMSSAVRFGNGTNMLPAGFGIGGALPDTTNLDSNIFTAGGFTRLQLNSSGSVELPADVRLIAGPGGNLALTGRRIDVQGTLATPGGDIALTAQPLTAAANPADLALTVGGSGRVSTAGTWVSDSAALRSGDGRDPVVLKGGTISLTSAADINLAAGSLIDVSGGGWLQGTGKYGFGDAGSITLSTGTLTSGAHPEARMVLRGALAGYGLSNGIAAGKGGSLNLTASNVSLGGVASGRAGELYLDESFFAQGGFRSFSITGRDDVAVAADASIRPAPASHVVTLARGGSGLAWTWTPQLLSDLIRSPGSLKLAALSIDFGNVTVGSGAQLAVDDGGSIALAAGKSIHVDATLEAAGGSIALTQTRPTQNDEYLAERTIWLGDNAQLLARGYSRLTPNALGLRQGVVHNGGAITLDAAKGYLVTRQGALLDVSGASATLDTVSTDGGRPVRTATLIGSEGGTVSLAAREGMLLDGNFAAKGRTGSLGGALAIAFDGGTMPWISFDAVLRDQINSPRRLVLKQSHDAGTAGMTVGQAFDTATRNGLATVAADKIEAGEFAAVALASKNRIELDGTLTLGAQRSIRLDAPNLTATHGATAILNAGLVSLGNSDTERQGNSYRDDAGIGPGTLTVNARHVDLEGTLTLQDFGSMMVNSRGDVALRGVVTGSDYQGAFISGGDIAINAARIYPSTQTDFAVEIHNNASGTISIGHLAGQSGDGGGVLSAGGRLVLAAPKITQGGTIKTPFGAIELRSESIARVNDVEARVSRPAGGAVKLDDGSVTSVSGEGQVIPYGKTDLSGRDWVYLLGGASRTLGSAPAKRILLDGNSIAKSASAVIDLSGSGELKAWEFLPGTGGSKDVLDPAVSANTYAIVPTLQGAYAPYDLQSWSGTTGLAGGNSIVLGTAVGGLAAGSYVLLPARYALLPDAYTVRFAGALDAKAGQAQAQPNGGWQVAANRATETLAGLVTSARTELAEIASGDVARTRSEYIESTASKHFAGGGSRLAGDAGQLAVRAGSTLTLDGTLNTGFAANHRGAEVDITASKLAVVARAGTEYGNGYMTLAADTLNRLGATSMVLGGIRERDQNGTKLTVSATDVVLDNAGSVLSAPDLILAATDKVTLAENAAITASGGASAERLRTTGDGALLRVSGNGLGGIVRTATSRTRGTLEVNSGATLSGAAVTLDATGESSFAGVFGKAAEGSNLVKALALGAQRINLGEVPLGTAGLTLNQSRLAELGAIDTLRLKSHTSIDLYGTVGAGDTLKTLELQAGGIAGVANAGKAAGLAAQSIALSNPDGIDFEAVKPAGLGSGTLSLSAAEAITLGAGDFRVAGFGESTLHAGREIIATGSGSHANAGKLTLESGRITATGNARQKIAAAGALGTTAVAQTAPFAAASAGGQLSLAGTTLDHSGRIDLPAGKITLSTSAGDLKLLAGSQLNAQGTAQSFADTTVFASGGQVVLESKGGNVAQDAAASINVSGASDAAGNGGHAGAMSVVASGTAALSGTLNAATGSAAMKGGRFRLDANGVSDLSGLAVTLAASGFSESVAVRARNGDMSLAADATLQAHGVLIAADNGNLTVAGTIEASGTKGGSIELYANRGASGGGRLTLAAGSVLKANATERVASGQGTAGRGGTVVVGVGATAAADEMHTAIDFQAASRSKAAATIDVSAPPGSAAPPGSVVFRVPRKDTEQVLQTLAGMAIDPASSTFSVLNGAGSATAYTLATSMASYQPGMVAAFAAPATSTGALTLNVNGKGARALVQADGTAFSASARITSGQVVTAVYDGTRFVASSTGLADTGISGSAYKVAFATKPAALATGMLVSFRARNANPAGAVTLAVNGDTSLTASLVDQNGAALAANAIRANQLVTAVYDGARFRLVKDTSLVATPIITASSLAGTLAANGSITGAGSTSLEAVRTISKTYDVGINSDMARACFAQTRAAALLFANPATAFTFRPGLQILSTRDITVSDDWNFGSARYSSQPGFLTLRAAGNVNLNASLSDGFASALSTAALLPAQDSWAYRIAAGADTAAAAPLALKTPEQLGGRGNLALAAARLVRTGTGSIDIAAGGNITAAADTSVIYTAGTTGQSIAPSEFASIHSSNNPSFPTNGGDLEMIAQGNIGFVRGTQNIVDWLYRQGRLKADGTLGNTSNGNAGNTAWWLNFPQFKQGVGALGGGDVSVAAGGDISSLSVSTPTNARLKGAANSLPNAANLVTHGGGDIALSAGGNIYGGVYFAPAGNLDIAAAGAVGNSSAGVTLALGGGHVRVEAGQGAIVDRVIDPFLTAQASGNISSTPPLAGNINRITYFSGYSVGSGVDLTTLSGDLVLGVGTLAPPTLNLASLDGSIRLTGGALTMAPAAGGNLGLFAANSVAFGNTYVSMSDAPVSSLASPLKPQLVLGDATAVGNKHSSPVLHLGDPEPVRVVALRGDIEGWLDANSLVVPKRATIIAGGDITNLGVVAQNLADTDVSRMAAGGNIVFQSTRNSTGGLATNTKSVEWGGPGRLEIVAGGDIDLGSSKGVVTRGNLGNSFLPEAGAGVFMQAGAAAADYAGFLDWLEKPEQAKVRELPAYASLASEAARAAFLAQADGKPLLRDAFYAILRGVGRAAASAGGAKDYSGGYDAIAALFPEANGPYRGNIDMFFSQVKTEQGGGIDLMAPGGRVNAGLAVSSGLTKGAGELGIVTARGGSVRAFVRDEFAVNQSRVFTLQGGDILIWSSESDIDAGKGSKTAAATPPPQIIVRGDKIILDTSNSVSGSGIGVLLGKEGVAAGAVDLIAPKGTVIAGEAGIRATGDVFIPGKVSGADNVQAGGSKVGMPQVEVAAAPPPPPAPPPTDAGKAAEQAVASSASGGAREPGANSILTVEVLGVGEEEERRNN